MRDAGDRGRSIRWLRSLPFLAVHAAAAAGVWTLGWSWRGIALAIAFHCVGTFFMTAGYHRYFAHRTFKTSRAMQLVFAVGAMTTAQKGVLWWVSHHRRHHRYPDQPGDVHSAVLDGFVWSHLGWILSPRYEATELKRVRDLARYPELRWLDRWWYVPPVALGLAMFLAGGWFAFVWGFCVPTVTVWHATFTVNSITHMAGSRRYATPDNSRNNALIAALTLGEGWHNNHHHYPRSTRLGFFWWEIDVPYYLLRGMAALGLVWDLRVPPARVLRLGRREEARQPVQHLQERDEGDRLDDPRGGDLPAGREYVRIDGGGAR